MKTMIKTAGAASLLAMAVAGTSAVAAPLAELGFSQHTGFNTPVFPDGASGSLIFDPTLTVPNTDTLAPAGTNTSFSWQGANSDPDRSSIEIVSYSNSSPGTAAEQIIGGSNAATPLTDTFGDPLRLVGATQLPNGVVTGGVADADGQWNAGDWWVIDTLIQTNNELTSRGGNPSDPLWQVDALANLRFYADAARTDLAYADPETSNNISFYETLNTGTLSACDSLNPLDTLCDDVFTVSSSALAPVSFYRGNYRYDISFGLLPGDSAEAGVDAGKSFVVDNGDGTLSVFTPETRPGKSSIHVAMSYTATAVPEPSVLGLVGAGMLALGFAGRRRKQVQAK